METKSDAQILEDAADIIDRQGLHRGGFVPRSWREDGVCFTDAIQSGAPCCIVGALLTVSDYSETPGTSGWDLGEYAAGEEPANWNDHPDRTKEEVVTALRDAAARKRLEAGE